MWKKQFLIASASTSSTFTASTSTASASAATASTTRWHSVYLKFFDVKIFGRNFFRPVKQNSFVISLLKHHTESNYMLVFSGLSLQGFVHERSPDSSVTTGVRTL